MTASPAAVGAPVVPAGPSFEWPDAIAEPFLDQMRRGVGLAERAGPSGDPRYVMRHPVTGDRTGAIQVFDGDGIDAMVLSTARTPMLRMWQAVAYAPADSALPHLSFDAKANPAGCWFSIDLVPRVAPTEEHAWADYVYEPLSELVWSLHERDDMRQSLLRPRHRMHLSPWLISMRLDDASAVEPAIDAVNAVTDRFLALVRDGIPSSASPAASAAELRARDARERGHLYSWDATANYKYLAMIAGDEAVELVHRIYRDPSA